MMPHKEKSVGAGTHRKYARQKGHSSNTWPAGLPTVLNQNPSEQFVHPDAVRSQQKDVTVDGFVSAAGKPGTLQGYPAADQLAAGTGPQLGQGSWHPLGHQQNRKAVSLGIRLAVTSAEAPAAAVGTLAAPLAGVATQARPARPAAGFCQPATTELETLVQHRHVSDIYTAGAARRAGGAGAGAGTAASGGVYTKPGRTLTELQAHLPH